MRARAEADRADPWLAVKRRQSGLLRYARARGAVALAVHYATCRRRIYFRLPLYNDACNFLDRADVALNVDASTVGRVVITRVTGVGLLVPEATLPVDVGAALEVWPAGTPARAIVLVPETVHQIPAADDLRHPPLGDHGSGLPGTFADSPAYCRFPTGDD